jgi:hypothetical protein
MLVYANHLSFEGGDAEEAVFKAIGAWTKEQLGYGLRPDQHREHGEYKGSRDGAPTWLRVSSTYEEEPQLYSWVLKVADSTVRGRQWVTELGLKIQNSNLFFSCILRTDEQSTLVAENVTSSQPRVIRYLVENIQKSNDAHFHGSVPGSMLRSVTDIDSCRALLGDIEDERRGYPIVLVSPSRDGDYLLNSKHLQQIVIGLAQVVEVSSELNSYEMEEILGRHWSAWDGAVNVLHTRTPNGFIRGRVFRTDEIETWGDTQNIRIAKLLAWVTNNTNVPKMRKRVRPEGVAQLALRRRLQLSRARTSDMDDAQLRQELENVWQLADEQSSQIVDLEGQVKCLEGDVEQKEAIYQESLDTIRGKDFDITSLKGRLQQASMGKAVSIDVDRMIGLATRPDQPTPIECLDIIEEICVDSCVVLASAKTSARDMNNFVLGRKLLKNIYLLVTDYREKLMDGGDNLARNVFGRNEYAATESETVTSSQELRRRRMFDYEGESVEMFRHLKIGVEDDTSKTIRVHFYWDAKKSRIVIGYCGKHLPIST